MKTIFAALFCLLTAVNAFANASHEATPEEAARAVHLNQKFQARVSRLGAKWDPIVRPVEDTAKFKYVLLSADTQGVTDAANLRAAIAQNLPSDMTLVLLAGTWEAANVRRTYEQWLPADRLIVATTDYPSGGFWARDAFPVPVYVDERNNVGLMSVNYDRPFSGQSAVAASVGAQKVFRHDFVFVGGNLLADEYGNCFAVQSTRMYSLNGETLKAAYGCKSITMLPHMSGIGDIDEVVKPIGGGRILTNTRAYIPQLQSQGYEVIEFPDLTGTFRTYINSVILGNIVFMPAYGVPQDSEAIAIYQRLGYHVIPVRSNTLSDNLRGSVHCQTMMYPEMDMQKFLGEHHFRIVQ